MMRANVRTLGRRRNRRLAGSTGQSAPEQGRKMVVSPEQAERASEDILECAHKEREERRDARGRLRRRLVSPIASAVFAAYSMYMSLAFVDAPIKAMLIGAFVGWVVGALVYREAASPPERKTQAVSSHVALAPPRYIAGSLRFLSGACGMAVVTLAFRWPDWFEAPLDQMPVMVGGILSALCMMLGVYLLFFALTGDWLPRLTKRRWLA